MHRKSIWIFNHYAITPNLLGGKRHFDFGKELVKRDYRVTIFVVSFHFSIQLSIEILKYWGRCE